MHSDSKLRNVALLPIAIACLGPLLALAQWSIQRTYGTEMPTISGLVTVATLIGAAYVVQRSHARRAQEERSAELLTHLVDAVEDYAIYALDVTGRVVSWNHGAARCKGYTAKEILGRSFEVFYPPEDVAAGRPTRALETARTEGRFEGEGERLRKDGTRFRAAVLINPIRDSAGRHIGFSKITRDITARTKADDLLKVQQRQLLEERDRAERALAEVNTYRVALDEHAIVAMTDRKGTIVEANTLFARISGYSKEELVGNTHALVNSGVHSKEFFANLWKTISSGSVWTGEICNRTKSGEIYWVYTTIVPQRDASGTIARYAAVRTDITERKLSEEALRRAKEEAESANREKSQFVANVSHEIRTPLTSIIGFTEELITKEVNAEERRTQLDIILRNARHLIRIINEILDCSRIEAGKQEFFISDTPLAPIIDDVGSIMLPQAAKKGISLSFENRFPLPRVVRTDATRLKQIIFNLVDNAVKFTQRGGVSVVVSCDFDRELLVVTVSDSGIGIPVERQDRIFASYGQVNPSVSREFGGSGLGLFISREIARALGGDITFKSEEGSGSEFTAYLKVSPLDLTEVVHDREMFAAIMPPPIGWSDMTFDGKVLLAEDVADTRALLSAILRSHGLQVHHAADGQEAIHKAASEPFDLIFMDMRMPVMDGLTATRELRAAGYYGPIVALTANIAPGKVEEYVLAGCDACLGKPFDRRELSRVLTLFLSETTKEVTSDCGASFAQSAAEFVRLFDKRLIELSRAMDARDLEYLRSTAHSLAGAAAFGYPRVCRALSSLENAAENKDFEECSKLVEHLGKLHSKLTEESVDGNKR